MKMDSTKLVKIISHVVILLSMALFASAQTPATFIGWKSTGAVSSSNLFQAIDGMPRFSATNYYDSIAEGIVTGHSRFFKPGYQPSLGTTEIPIWPVSSTYTYISTTTGAQLALISASADDAAAGTGVQQVAIDYLTVGWIEGSETVTLNGTNAVNLVANNVIRITRMSASRAGSGGKAAGNISLQPAGGTQPYSRILAGRTSSLQLIYTVPINKTLYLTEVHGGCGAANKTAFVEFRLKANIDNSDQINGSGLFFTKATFSSGASETGSLPFSIPRRFPQKTDIRLDAVADAAGNICVGGFDGWLEID